MKRLLLMGLLFATPAYALVVDTPLPDPAQETAAQALFHDLRCVVCTGEAIADSPSAVAADMRRYVRDELAAGKTPQEIKSTLVARYGERVLMLPEVRGANALLWLAPLLLLVTGVTLAWWKLFRGSVHD